MRRVFGSLEFFVFQNLLSDTMEAVDMLNINVYLHCEIYYISAVRSIKLMINFVALFVILFKIVDINQGETML